VLGYDDRTRIIDDADRGLSVSGARFVLVDGRVAATWTVVGDGDAATLRVTPLRRLGRQDRDAVADEGRRLVAFLSDGASTRETEIISPDLP
jgi:Winged helix DNA-binding domain